MSASGYDTKEFNSGFALAVLLFSDVSRRCYPQEISVGKSMKDEVLSKQVIILSWGNKICRSLVHKVVKWG